MDAFGLHVGCEVFGGSIVGEFVHGYATSVGMGLFVDGDCFHVGF